MSRTIDISMNWHTAAQIIAAALENGTGAGKQAARAELGRMAAILDSMADQQSALFEVIAHSATTGAAFGQTFEAQSMADSYAQTMQAKGYIVDDYPAFCPVSNAAEALAQARAFFNDESLTPETETQP